MEPDEPMAYIALRPCGCFVMAVADIPANVKSTAREVAACIRDSFAVERVTCAYVREHFRVSCAACKPAKQEVMEL